MFNLILPILTKWMARMDFREEKKYFVAWAALWLLLREPLKTCFNVDFGAA